MQKKKIKFLFSFVLVAILVCICSFVYAAINEYYVEQTETQLTTSAITTEVNSILTALGEPSTKALKANSNINLDTKEDIYRNIEFYTVSTQDYKINLDSNTKKVVNIFKQNCDFTTQTTSTKDNARSYITDMYSKLNLPSEYDLVYLEPFSDTLWEADFQKNYDGVYNMYEAVKVIFNPAVQEILALTVFDESYTQSNVATASVLSEDDVVSNSIDALSIDEDSIQEVKTTFIKPSSLLNSDSTDNTIRKAKVIKHTYMENEIEITALSYIDFYTGEFIGGDLLQ